MIFSEIARSFGRPANALYAERRRLEAVGCPLNDLVSGNVTENGIRYPLPALHQALHRSAENTSRYRPHPLGQLPARRAVARYYRAHGLSVSAEQILLTPGTSLAYAYLFQIFAEPRDEILCPRPSYPLFEMIAAAAQAQVTFYDLKPGVRWAIDAASVAAAITPRTRAIVLVSPHNPTGAVATQKELATMASLAARHHLPIIADEVFAPFLVSGSARDIPRAAATTAPLVLTLGGFSKMFALPGMKIGWVLVTGEPTLVTKTLHALEMLSDTYLPVNEIAQGAVPEIFTKGRAFLMGYQAKVRQRSLRAMEALSAVGHTSFIPAEGGFYLTVALDNADEEAVCAEWLKRYHVVAHPGYFYDLTGSHVILSLVQRPTSLMRGLESLRKILS